MRIFTTIIISLIFCYAQGQQIDDITPNQADAGETLEVTITGTNTFFTQATNTAIFFFFSGSSSTATVPNFYTIDNDNQITANLTVPLSTFQGWYDYSVYTDVVGTLYQVESFQVFGEINNVNNEVKGSFEAQLYPNPTNGNLSIKLANSKNTMLDAKIMDATGKQVHTTSLKNGDNQISLEHLVKGVYFVKITEGDTMRTYKIVKN